MSVQQLYREKKNHAKLIKNKNKKTTQQKRQRLFFGYLLKEKKKKKKKNSIHSLRTRISRRRSERRRCKNYNNKQKNNLLNVRKKEKRKSCILCYLLYVTFYFPGTLVYIQDVPPDTQPPRASPSNVNPVAAISPFYKATLFRLRLRGSENSGLCPTRG